MPSRRESRSGRSWSQMMDALPERFLNVDFRPDGEMSQLRAYRHDLIRHMRSVLGYEPDQSEIHAVMTDIGLSHDVWYRAALTHTVQVERLHSLFGTPE
jgi:hypothetical protein